MYQLENINVSEFLKEHWQKKPLVIKQGFTLFEDPLDEHDLAGLSEEASVDSRIVCFTQGNWQVEHGPFEDINQYCKGAWSLLVQSVDHFIPEADQLMRAFDFIPHWRMDDLMVSFSNKNAGVGAHIDQYDVFIIQGKGSRRWQVGLPGQYDEHSPHKDLKQISVFEPVIDEILLAGDIIYIPPNHPHHGIALEDCLNYSVGFRAPSQQEILSSLADFAIDQELFGKRYQDHNLTTRQFSGEIKQQEIDRFKQLLQQVLETDQFSQWLPSFISQSKELTQEDGLAEDSYSHQEITVLLQSGCKFVRSPGVKPVFIDETLYEDQSFTFYINGLEYAAPTETADLIKIFLNSAEITENSKNNYQNCLFFTQLLTTLVNTGYWYPE